MSAKSKDRDRLNETTPLRKSPTMSYFEGNPSGSSLTKYAFRGIPFEDKNE